MPTAWQASLDLSSTSLAVPRPRSQAAFASSHFASANSLGGTGARPANQVRCG
jgi:hypothetical protein